MPVNLLGGVLSLVTFHFLIPGTTGDCTIGIAVDNDFKAYINGELFLEGDVYSILYTKDYALPTGVTSVNLTILAHNQQGASGVFVTSNDGVQSSTDTWNCAGPAQSFPTDNSQWLSATKVGDYGTSPWDRLFDNSDYAGVLKLEEADWIWNENYGVNGQTDGDENVVCWTDVTVGQCDLSQSVVVTDPPNGATNDPNVPTDDRSRLVQSGPCQGGVIVEGRYCLELVRTYVNRSTAVQRAANDGVILAPVLNQEYQDKIQVLMEEYGVMTEDVWVSGQKIDDLYLGPFEWITPCCFPGEAPTDLPLASQGCYTASTYGAEDFLVKNIDGVKNTTCMQACQDDSKMYAALQFNSTCLCGDVFKGTYGLTDGCDRPCAGEEGYTCGGINKLAIYTVGGQWAEWDGRQPNNYDGSFQNCLAIGPDTFLLKDETCGSKRRYICELPTVNGACRSLPDYNEHEYTDVQLRCFYSSTSDASWYYARQQCSALGGNLAVILRTELHQDLVTWLTATQTGNDYWVGAHRPNFAWAMPDGNVPVDEYDNYANGEPSDNANWRYMYISGDMDYQWKTDGGQSSYYYVTFKEITEVAPDTTPNSGTTQPATQGPATESPGTPAAAASTSEGLSTVTIVLIVLLILIVLIVILVFIIFCCCCYKRDKKNTVAVVGPRKYDARPIAPVPVGTKLGDDESGVYIVESDLGSTTHLVADPKEFTDTQRTPRYDWAY